MSANAPSEYAPIAWSGLAVLDDDELASRVDEVRQELFNLRFQLATGELKNTARLGQVRREVARLLTALRQREISEAAARLLSDEEDRS